VVQYFAGRRPGGFGWEITVRVAQLVRAQGCGPWGRGFESRLPPLNSKSVRSHSFGNRLSMGCLHGHTRGRGTGCFTAVFVGPADGHRVCISADIRGGGDTNIDRPCAFVDSERQAPQRTPAAVGKRANVGPDRRCGDGLWIMRSLRRSRTRYIFFSPGTALLPKVLSERDDSR
jgi:hypothetical protein